MKSNEVKETVIITVYLPNEVEVFIQTERIRQDVGFKYLPGTTFTEKSVKGKPVVKFTAMEDLEDLSRSSHDLHLNYVNGANESYVGFPYTFEVMIVNESERGPRDASKRSPGAYYDDLTQLDNAPDELGKPCDAEVNDWLFVDEQSHERDLDSDFVGPEAEFNEPSKSNIESDSDSDENLITDPEMIDKLEKLRMFKGAIKRYFKEIKDEGGPDLRLKDIDIVDNKPKSE